MILDFARQDRSLSVKKKGQSVKFKKPQEQKMKVSAFICIAVCLACVSARSYGPLYSLTSGVAQLQSIDAVTGTTVPIGPEYPNEYQSIVTGIDSKKKQFFM